MQNCILNREYELLEMHNINIFEAIQLIYESNGSFKSF